MNQEPPTPRLILVVGLPGSGKTTLATRLEQTHRAIRFSPDDWMDALHINLWDAQQRERIEALQWTVAQRLLELGQTVVIEWGTWARAERDTLRERARALGAAVELHYLEEPLDVLYERISTRNREDPPITRDDIAEWSNTIEPPTAEELALFDPPLRP